MTISELYNYLKANLSQLLPDSTERLAFARRMFTHITGARYQDTLMYPDRVADIDSDTLESVMKRVLNHEPLEYVFDSAQFLDMEFRTNGCVLIPRPETEELAVMVRNYLDSRGEALAVLDIGTGSGCIPVYLAAHCPKCRYTAFDISRPALDTAADNAARHGCDISFVQLDILRFQDYEDQLNGVRFDVIVSNPPYVMDSEKSLMQDNVLDYEPHTALFVPDADPLLFYRSISQFAARYLNEGGMLFFEINERLGKETATLMEGCGFCNVTVVKDLFSKDRFVTGVLASI